MNHKTFFKTSGLLFSAIAIVHLLRVVNGWEAVIGGWTIPLWVSWASIIIGAYLGFHGLKMSKR